MLFLSHGTIWKPRFLREPPPHPFQLIPLFLRNFFMTPLFIQISKMRTPPLGGGNYDFNNYSVDIYLFEVAIKTSV